MPLQAEYYMEKMKNLDILAEKMNRTLYRGMWSYSWDNSLIYREKPDYIIYLIAEWNIDAILY